MSSPADADTPVAGDRIGGAPQLPHLRSFCADVGRLARRPLDVKEASKVDRVEKTLESTLTRLDEFQAFISSVSASRREAEEKVIPLLMSKVSEIEAIYDEVDRLEELLDAVDASTSRVEAMAQRADPTAPKPRNLKALFGSFVDSVQQLRKKPRGAVDGKVEDQAAAARGVGIGGGDATVFRCKDHFR